MTLFILLQDKVILVRISISYDTSLFIYEFVLNNNAFVLAMTAGCCSCMSIER